MDGKLVTVDKESFAQRGQEIYEERLRSELEPEHKGDMVAIDVDTGEYFLGKSTLEAVKRGRERYPGKIFYLVRVGFPVVRIYR